MEYYDYLDDPPILVVYIESSNEARELFQKQIAESPQSLGFFKLPFIKVVLKEDSTRVYCCGSTDQSTITIDQLKQLILTHSSVRRTLYEEFIKKG